MSNLYMISFEGSPQIIFEPADNDADAARMARYIVARKLLDGETGPTAFVNCVARNIEFVDMVNASEIVNPKRKWTLGVPAAIEKHDAQMAEWAAEDDEKENDK